VAEVIFSYGGLVITGAAAPLFMMSAHSGTCGADGRLGAPG
jgi:hypothetical protein